MFRPWRRSERGMTLIELLVVAVIIGILAAYVGVRIRNAINKARKAALVSYMVSDFRGAMREYYFDNGGYPIGAGPTDPTVVLKAGDYITNTFSEKTAGLNISVNALYFSGVSLGGGGLLGGGPLLSVSSTYSYTWCLLYPATIGIDLPCIKLTEGSLEEFATMPPP